MDIASLPLKVRKAAADALRAAQAEILAGFLRRMRAEPDFRSVLERVGGESFARRLVRDDVAALAAALERADPSVISDLVRRAVAESVAHGISLTDAFRGKALLDRELTATVRRAEGMPAAEREQAARLLADIFDRTVLTLVQVYESHVAGRARREVDEERHKLDHVARAVGAGLSVIDPEFRIVWMNRAHERWFGALESVRGRPCYEVYQHKSTVCENCPSRRTFEDGEVHTSEQTGVTAAGERRVYLLTTSPLRDADGRVAQVLELVQDVTEERASQQLVGLLAHTIESSREGLALMDLDGCITYVNPALAAMFGLPREAFVGRPGKSFAPGLTEEEVRRIREIGIADRWTGDVEARRADGSAFPVRASLSVVRDEQGRRVALVASARDLTREKDLQRRIFEQERRHLEELEHEVAERTAELERANRELQELDAMKDRFLANVSHELRTPLVSALGYVELALHGRLGRLPQEARGGLVVAHRNVLRLVGLIEDLLACARLQAGRDALVRAPVEVGSLIEDALLDLKGRSTKAHLEVASEIEPGLPRADGDDEKIARVLANVLSNAEKFTGEDAHVWVRARRAGDGFVEVAVEDDGVGVPPEERERVFDRFYRTRTASARCPGTGIGLSLAREIVEAHGGRIWIEPREPVGTRILFTLPEGRAARGAARGAPSAAAPDAAADTAATILVVDDDPEVHRLLCIAFADRPWRLVRADSGAAGLAAAREERDLALVLLDICLEDTDGIEVCRRLKADAATCHLPVYFLTARPDERAAAEARSVGCAGFITKPFNVAELTDRIDRALEARTPGG